MPTSANHTVSNDTTTDSARPPSLLSTAAITIMATMIMTGISMVFGGFGSQDAMQTSRGISLPILVHVVTALAALLLGPIVLLRRKGDRWHRRLGRVWVLLMLVTALASAFIRSPGAGLFGTGFSALHLFTVWTLISAPLGIWLASQKRIAAHQGMMTGLYIGLVLAGSFTLIPGRLLGSMVFG